MTSAHAEMTGALSIYQLVSGSLHSDTYYINIVY